MLWIAKSVFNVCRRKPSLGALGIRIRIEERKVHAFSSQLKSLHNALTLHR